MTRDQDRSGVLSGELANHVAIVSRRSPNDLVDQAEYRVALNRHPFHGPPAWQLVVGSVVLNRAVVPESDGPIVVSGNLIHIEH